MKKVEIYSTQTCHFCHQAKEFFQTNNIQFTDHDVTTDKANQQEMIKRSGLTFVPQIYVDDVLVEGFDEPKLRELLEIK
jgi:glutaredoxin-like YruB-family protein